jgi:hypothetical protein
MDNNLCNGSSSQRGEIATIHLKKLFTKPLLLFIHKRDWIGVSTFSSNFSIGLKFLFQITFPRTFYIMSQKLSVSNIGHTYLIANWGC